MVPIRLKDIAARAGVSVMTVSKVLHDSPDISGETKTRVKLLAQQMGYVPDAMAQSLRNRRSRLIGLVLPSIANPIFARMVLAVEDRAHELGYDVILAQTHNVAEREDSCLLRLLSRRVDGLLISPVYRPSAEARAYQELLARGTPTVILGPVAPFCSQFANVEGEEALGSARVTAHLLELGHRRIAFLAGPLLAPWAQARLEGYKRALREHAIEVDDRLIFQAGGLIEDGTKAALQMINESCDATAVQAVNDLVAIGCAEALMGQGIWIPEDISLTGYGNVLTAEHFRVPLTTVRQPKHRLGTEAVECLLQVMRGEKPASRRLVAELAVRASTGPPPARNRVPATPAERT